MRPVDTGPLVATVEQVWNSLDDRTVLRKLWRRTHPGEAVPISYRAAAVFVWCETYSFDAPSVAECCWLASANGLRLALACIRFDEYDDGTKALTVLDLFVWPTYRRRGYEGQLLRHVMARGAKRGCVRMDVLCYDADNLNGQDRTRGFLKRFDLDVRSEPDAQVVLMGSTLLS